MPYDAEIHWNDTVLAVELANVSWDVIRELTHDTAVLAQAIAPVRMRHTPLPPRSKRHIGSGGSLKASVHEEYGEDAEGKYGDVVALWYGRFLDPPARQLHRLHPFLPTALFVNIARFEAKQAGRGSLRGPGGRFISPYL